MPVDPTVQHRGAIIDYIGTCGLSSYFPFRCVEPSILVCFGDSKPVVREAAVAALSAWKERCGLIPMTENDMLSEALKVSLMYFWVYVHSVVSA